MNNSDKIRILHMIDAAAEAISFVEGKAREELNYNRMLVLSIIKDVEIIGEAASKLTSATKEKYPTIPWQDIIWMRNRLIHGYFDVDLDIVWNTVITDIPGLLVKLKNIIDN